MKYFTPDLDGALWILGLGFVAVTVIGLCTATGALEDPPWNDDDVAVGIFVCDP